MNARGVLLSAGLVLAALGSAQARKLTLPVGVWGHEGLKGPNCKKPFLKIEENRIIQRFDEGEGRCTVKNTRKKSNIIFIKAKCDWDAGVPENIREGTDDDGDSFSIKSVSKARILFSNTEFGLCPSTDGGAR